MSIPCKEEHKAIADGYREIFLGFEKIYLNYRRQGYLEEAATFEKIADGFKEVCLKYEKILSK